MLQLEQAVARILDCLPAPRPQVIPLPEACGRVLLEKVAAPMDLPCFDNSAMDGFALRAADLAAASVATPVRLRMIERLPAGSFPAQALAVGTCSRVFTGSPLPVGADAVVMQEDTTREENSTREILFREPIEPGENIRRQGEDIRRGSLLLDAGRRIFASHLMLLGSVGLAKLTVGVRPAVGLLATGSELQEPGSELHPGGIYESNRLGLQGFLQAAGARCRIYPIVPDDPAATRQSLAVALRENDLVVTSGGVSVGELDFVKPAFEAEGGHFEFWRLNMKPGRPFVFGSCRGKFLFGLPGNPLSALVTCLLLVRPAVLKWQGATEVELPSHPGILGETVVNDGPRRHFLRVRVGPGGEVHPAGLQASHGLGALADANGLLDVPGGVTWEAGRPVRVLRWG
jgi:molybdopterin molybdotransferase